MSWPPRAGATGKIDGSGTSESRAPPQGACSREQGERQEVQKEVKDVGASPSNFPEDGPWTQWRDKFCLVTSPRRL